jgi:hypothetical protein
MAVELRAFSGLDGSPVRRLRYSKLEWSDSINEAGSLSATVVDRGDVDQAAHLRPYGTILAAVEGATVRHAGYVTGVRHSRADGVWQVTAGGGSTILAKRLVLNRNLRTKWQDGTVVIDDKNPPGDWVLTATGSYSDLISALISETEAWGELPIDPASATGGDKTRTWDSWDLATVADRISDIGDLEAGPEWRLDPYLASYGGLRFRQVTSADGGEIVEDSDGSEYTCARYLTGGRDEDRLLVAHASSAALTSRGWPLLQTADTSHSQVSVLATLQAYASSAVSAGSRGALTTEVRVPASLQVHVGDHADVRYGTGAGDVLALKVTDVRCAAGDATQTIGCRGR